MGFIWHRPNRTKKVSTWKEQNKKGKDYQYSPISYRIYEELTNFGDKMSVAEAKEALRYAPLIKPKSLDDPAMIDYPAFCRLLSGLRKREEPQ